ncbi:hypothetical protein Emtol_2807 [Emticicia oligotrophica DSM 17448]|uniref:DUF3822 family protein n=1 Tax=Emticicia oligotrophica (strain DSM 17448 / CIP 109782 / MTCC 6937 / GPTSA100-15) TaxID=929562 RepID=A0ABN4ARA4_EMTOG|nr:MULTISPECIES: DUF3822 family protein [Emticicia]AFK03942.1 hypothetical protein Emtol_2807 [Emticicia oligotrophica DSM 17448]
MENLTLNITPSFEIKDDRFDTNQIADCHLLIEVSRDRFRFTVYNSIYDLVMWLEDYHVFSLLNENQLLKTLKNVYQNHQFLAANYWKTIRLSVNANHFTLIPEEYYESNEAAKYLNFAAGRNISEKEQIIDFRFSRFGAVCIFGIEKETITWFKEMYPARKIDPIPVIGTLIEGIVEDKNNQGLHIYFEDYYITIIYFKDSKLHFCNRFHFRTSQDMVYHVLFVMNELGLQTDTPVIFYGEITSFSDRYIQLGQSLSNIKFALNPSKIRFSQYFSDLPEHRYYSLFSSYYLY